MKGFLSFLALVVFVSAESVQVVNEPVQVIVDSIQQDVPLIKDNPVYGYLTRVAVPLAEKIRKAEEKMLKNPSDNQDHSRVVGGIPATTGQFPWLAGLIIDIIGFNGNGVCGGTLVSSTKVVTAAHCWNDGQNQAWKITVVLGSLYLFSGGMRLETSVLAMHPSWSPLLVRNDIGVAYLPLAIGSSPDVSPISMPVGFENEDFIGESAMIAGYGLTTETGSITNTQSLQYVPVAVISNTACFLSFPLVITNSHICTSGAGGVGTCGGDSGGPLVVSRNDKPILIGITSFTSASGCSSGSPAGYTRVTSHMDFLRQHV